MSSGNVTTFNEKYWYEPAVKCNEIATRAAAGAARPPCRMWALWPHRPHPMTDLTSHSQRSSFMSTRALQQLTPCLSQRWDWERRAGAGLEPAQEPHCIRWCHVHAARGHAHLLTVLPFPPCRFRRAYTAYPLGIDPQSNMGHAAAAHPTKHKEGSASWDPGFATAVDLMWTFLDCGPCMQVLLGRRNRHLPCSHVKV